ncbi:MAG: hypothetical protein C4K48_12885 [Candidatus Thorarchaeota archaeon]|nr:MAG: hypothetical protein C4K48_12885 [Candidatus Thorarchaeota archaeon]
MAGNSLGLSPLQKSMIIGYAFFVVAYSLSIMTALLIGGIGGLVPRGSLWFRVTYDLLRQSTNLAMPVFISILPLLVMLNLNYIWFKHLSTSEPLSARKVSIQTVLGVFVALPLLILAVSMMVVSAESIIGWYEQWPVYGVIFFVVSLLYMLVISVISASEKKRFLVQSLTSARLWVPYVLVSVLLAFPVAGVILPFFKGYWMSIPLGRALDTFLRAFWVSLVLPVLPYIFARLSVKPDSPSGFSDEGSK